MKRLLITPLLFANFALCEPDTLPPLIVTGDKLATTPQDLPGNFSLLGTPP